MKSWDIDINCDVGEGIGNETSLLPLISSCNIACGGHAGDANSIGTVIRLAKKYDVKIGAHPSYPDKANFGREVMGIPDAELKQSIEEQLSTFNNILEKENGELNHIKAHGALYNEIAKNRELAMLYLDAVLQYSHSHKAKLYVPFDSVIAKKAIDLGFTIVYEAFGDRNYNDDLSLVSRKESNSLIEKPREVLNHVLPIIKEGKVITVSGQKVKILADTLCIHGDTPSALEILMYLSKELPNHKVQLQR